jgi:hypothetical protein
MFVKPSSSQQRTVLNLPPLKLSISPRIKRQRSRRHEVKSYPIGSNPKFPCRSPCQFPALSRVCADKAVPRAFCKPTTQTTSLTSLLVFRSCYGGLVFSCHRVVCGSESGRWLCISLRTLLPTCVAEPRSSAKATIPSCLLRCWTDRECCCE